MTAVFSAPVNRSGRHLLLIPCAFPGAVHARAGLPLVSEMTLDGQPVNDSSAALPDSVIPGEPCCGLIGHEIAVFESAAKQMHDGLDPVTARVHSPRLA